MPAHGAVTPLTRAEMLHLFGTPTPNVEQVEGRMSVLRSYRQRWQGTVVVIYEGDQPSELLFMGESGD